MSNDVCEPCVDDFDSFFIGNTKAYAQLSNKGWFAVKKYVTATIIRSHLDHKITIGSYCGYKLGDSDNCRWICIDFDEHHPEFDGKAVPTDILSNSYERMSSLYSKLQNEFNIQDSNTCFDYSGGGYHLWIKLYNYTHLSRAYDFVKCIEKKYNIKDEIFPKQGILNKLGNQVKLPHSLHRKRGNVHCGVFECSDFKYLKPKDFSKQGNGFIIPDYIPKFMDNRKVRSKQNIKSVIVEERSECFEWFLDHIRPCLRRLALDNSLTHGCKGDMGHRMNLTLADTLIGLGAKNEVIHEIFKTHPSYDPSKTEIRINSIRNNFNPNYARISCSKIEERGFCIGC